MSRNSPQFDTKSLSLIDMIVTLSSPLYNRSFQKMSTDQQQLQESKVQILGYFPINTLQTQQTNHQDHSHQIHKKIQTFIEQKQQPSKFVPINVVVESNSIAIIDIQQRGWLITNLWKEPISLTDLLRLKIHKITLGYNQLVAHTRQGCILLTWGNKKPVDEVNLTKYPIRTFKNKAFQLFQAFTINDSTKADLFLFPNLKKVAESQALFLIKSSDPHIISFPKLQKISFSHRIIGLSVGKYHKLCWDTEGKLFSWGCKSLALGHEYLPQEFQISEPKVVHNMKSFVLKAYAGVNYSLAVTIQGRIFQWGIKKEYPKGEELVFDPREIQTPKGQRFVDLKGKGDKYAALSTSGKLYVWGKNVKGYFSMQKNSQWQGQNGWDKPTLVKQVTDCIIDFSIEDSFIAVVTGKKQFTSVSDSQKRYWANVKTAITKKLRVKTPRIATQFCEDKQNQLNTNRASLSLRHCVDPIQIAFNKRQSKIKYIKEAQNSQKIINFIMQQPKLNLQLSDIGIDREITYRDIKKLGQLNRTQMERPVDQSLRKLFYECEQRKEYAEFLVKGVYALQAKNKAYKIKRNKETRTRQSTQPKTEIPYSARLQEALKRKEDLGNQFFQKTISKLESESAECRMRKRFEAQQRKKKKKEIDLCSTTLQKQLIKAFLIKLCVKPISEARDIKIANFASHLKLQRLENNIRGLFVKNRIKFKMRKMFQNQIFRYSLMTVVFRNYVKRFRERTFKSKTSFTVQSIMKNMIKQKIKVGISTCTFNVRKLQKFREWASMVKAQRKKCLKQMWKVYTLSMMKVNSDHQSSAIFYLPKNVDDLQFQTLYQEKVSTNPLLKLSNFLEKYSIFRIKANYFQKLVTLFTFENKGSKESRESKLINTFSKTRKYRIKFHEVDDTNDRLNLIQADILPYSTHYNLLVHPKNYDIMIPQIMKQHEKWVREEKKVFDKHLEIILHQHALTYTRQRRAYDYELAKFICKQYESLSQKRWKYIIEYNQTKQTFEKVKKEKELRRLLDLIGAQEKLSEDCLPEKYMILQEALRRSDAPPAPSSSIIFTMGDFKRHFKSYYQALFLKAKELRRTCF